MTLVIVDTRMMEEGFFVFLQLKTVIQVTKTMEEET